VENLRAASDCTHAAILAAENNAGTRIDHVYLAQSGAHLQGFRDRGLASVSSPDAVVAPMDVRRATENAKSRILPPGRIYIHHVHSGYMLDGRPVGRPGGHAGRTARGGLLAHPWRRAPGGDHLHVINGFGLRVEDMIVSSIASAGMVTSDAEKQSGVLVLDIGSGTTDYALYRGAASRARASSRGRRPPDQRPFHRPARRRPPRRKHQAALRQAVVDKVDKGDNVMLIGDLTIGDRPIPRIAIYKILHARVEELFMILKNKLGSEISQQNLPGGIVITGGTSRLPHICEAARSVLGVEARVGENPAWVSDKSLRSPEYSTVLGLLWMGLTAQRQDDKPQPKSGGLLGKLSGIFK
jgi:cell division protein FtsA